ncbi:hypothetical protein GOODEAATRI_032437 [Goodea atripinnis]|uniref:Uncharacterized protein n=1 Tax=Goodea atripinnis TaxID=208336 RepID=A0ABV0MMJ9_9TELE
MNRVKPLSRTCTCGNLIAGADTLSVCASCLGLQHAQDSVASPPSCEHCARLFLKESPPWLKPFGRDQLDAVMPLTDPEEDEATLPVFSTFVNAESESEVESISLGSDDDEQDCEPYGIPSAAMPLVTDLHDVCRRAAKKLGIEWLETLTETTTSRYEGTRQIFQQTAVAGFSRAPQGSIPLTGRAMALGGSSHPTSSTAGCSFCGRSRSGASAAKSCSGTADPSAGKHF